MSIIVDGFSSPVDVELSRQKCFSDFPLAGFIVVTLSMRVNESQSR